ncbi:hypothetical protein JMA_08250 [Jeotgalibacillus malaysiensis]|uniref:Uncharacterized protein n=1 Tax=Jeotgalibacillus malaysiensis TaxID=1508404 RepID=A0A0B5ANA5_9BACL|nr:hypothetical protein JMA_08250 [Jeotgalibacillus malaysiensis]
MHSQRRFLSEGEETMKKIALCLIMVFLVVMLAVCGEKTRE